MSVQRKLFDCGCELSLGLTNGQPSVVLRACRPGCDILRWTLETADEKNTPVSIKEVDSITVTCLRCGAVNDGFSPANTEEVMPTAGSVSICIYCAAVSFFEVNADGDLYLRWPTDQEQHELDQDQDLARLLTIVKGQTGTN